MLEVKSKLTLLSQDNRLVIGLNRTAPSVSLTRGLHRAVTSAHLAVKNVHLAVKTTDNVNLGMAKYLLSLS